MGKKITCFLSLVLSYEKRNKNSTKGVRVFSCVIYTIIENYLYVDYLVCQSKKLSVAYIYIETFWAKGFTNSWVLAFQIC